MKREIEFRGKCVTDSKYAGEWVTGGYVAPDVDCETRNEGLIIRYLGNDTKIIYHVEADTVGQFTGLRDKNGVKIFEGDIVEVHDFMSVDASKYRGFVKMYCGYWCVEYEDSIFDIVAHPRLFFDDFSDRKIERIGNIYDNPEMIKKP